MPESEVAAGSEPSTTAIARQPRWRKRAIIAGILALAGLFAFFLVAHAGSFLIVHAPEPADVIVVLDGEWPKGVQLQREGYAPRILLDANVTRLLYGRTDAELAADFLAHNNLPMMEICPTTADSTFAEVVDVRRCLERLHASSALIVASNFDTRRALSIFRKRLPQYRWSIAASSAPYHDADQYWKHRAWAKTVLDAWEQFLWWKLADQWRSDVVLR